MIYYRYLFLHEEDLSPNEGLIYSELLFCSLISNGDYRTGELLYIDAAKDLLEKYRLLNWGESITYFPLDVSTLMSRTEMTFPTVKKALAGLEEKGYIRGGDIKCPLALIEEGYLKIPKDTGLKGRQLVFYGYLLNKAARYNGIIDTWAYRFKELCGIDRDNVYFIIKQLKKKGLVERLEDGRLKINKPKKK